LSAPHLGIWLATLGFITKRQLAQALEIERVTSLPLESVLVQQQFLTDEEIKGAHALQGDLGRATALHDLVIAPEVLALMPRPVALKEQVLPMRLIGERLMIAYARSKFQHDDIQRLFNRISQLNGFLLHGIAFPDEVIAKALTHFYDPKSAELLVKQASEMRSIVRAATATKSIVEVASGDDNEGPIIELVNKILSQAVDIGASDLHLRPTDDGLLVKVRLDGVMQPIMALPKEVEGAVVSRLKVMADLNIAERRRPQDGRMSIQVAGQPIDLRVACINSHWGEMMVLRLLRPLNTPAGFTSLGLWGQPLERWQRMVKAPNGLILVTGPTGSGKTSTLYATLNQFDKTERNILTAEDPVEYPVNGIGQIQVAPKVGLTFAAALRSMLRLDPDVILVGEIRDKETLDIALEAAMTGHLVLSTLHTNDAASAVGRMIEMGAAPHMVAACLQGVLAQRLVRRVCAHCSQAVEASPAEAAFLGASADEPPTLVVGAGCQACGMIGYKGRVAVYEVLEMNGDLADHVNAHASTQTLWRAAREGGMTTLLDDGRAKVSAHQTTVAEVQRVLGARERNE
jgi:type IV pilus assembly protein PilB